MFLATTTAANGGVMSTGMLIMWLVIMFGMMYFLMIRPQKKEQKNAGEKRGSHWGNRSKGDFIFPLTAPDNYLLIVRCKWSVDGADQRQDWRC